MKLKLAVTVVALAFVAACSAGCPYPGGKGKRSESASIPVLEASGSEISTTPVGQVIRFEAVVVDRPADNCIDLFIPEEFEKYNGDLKWAISATLGFKPGIFERMPAKSRAIVTGKYIFVRNGEGGPCGLVAGHLFVIDDIEYF